MEETRRMHYVPRTYLKHFAELSGKATSPEYMIHAVLASELTEDKIKQINIKNVCLENDLYTLPGETLEERQFLEKMYSDLYETDYDILYALLTDDSKETLTPGQRHTIISFVVSMFYRNATWGNSYNKLMDETYAKVFALAEQSGQQSFFMDEKEISIAGKTLEEFQKENKKHDRPMVALVQAQKIFELVRIREINDIVTIVKLEDTALEFVTGDNPVTLQDSHQQRPLPFDPANTLSIPIDSKHLLQLRPWAHEHQLETDTIWRMDAHSIIAQATSMINKNFQAKQSTRFVMGSKVGLQSFIQTKDRFKK